MDNVESPVGQGVADGSRHRGVGYRHRVRTITIRIQPRQPMGCWVNVVNLDASIENRTVFRRSRRGRHDLDVMTSIRQDVCQVPDMDLLPPDNWRVELRKHQDAHGTVRSLVARSWTT
jgi:hypothetical protein